MNTYGSIGNATAGWYSRKLLRHAMPVLILERYGTSKTLPRNETKVIEFRRSKAFTPATLPLTEGVTPSGSDFGYDTITAQIQQYGDWAPITDVIADTSKDQVLRDMSERQGEQIGETRELLMWDIVRAGTNVAYGGVILTRVTIDKTAVLNSAKQRSQVTMLDQLKAKKFTAVLKGSENYETFPIEPSYIAVGHSNLNPTIRDLKGSNTNDTFVPHSRYGQSMSMSSPREIGAFEDTRYVTSPDLPSFAGAGAACSTGDRPGWYNTNNKYDVYSLLFLGRDAFGCIALRGMKESSGKKVSGLPVRPAVLQPGTPRGGDPIGQRGSVGWSMYFACVMLNDTWARRLEIACPR